MDGRPVHAAVLPQLGQCSQRQQTPARHRAPRKGGAPCAAGHLSIGTVLAKLTNAVVTGTNVVVTGTEACALLSSQQGRWGAGRWASVRCCPVLTWGRTCRTDRNCRRHMGSMPVGSIPRMRSTTRSFHTLTGACRMFLGSCCSLRKPHSWPCFCCWGTLQ